MQKKLICGLAILLPLAFTGCTTMNEDECKVVDWRSLGSTDGQAGRSSTYIANHLEACSKFGIVPNQSQWQDGWATGVRTYCTSANGMTQGKAGKSNNYICPTDLASNFNQAYSVGRSVYTVRKERDGIQREIDTLQRELDRDTALAVNTDSKPGSYLDNQNESKERRLYELERKLNDVQYRLERAQNRADQYLYWQRLGNIEKSLEAIAKK